MHWTDVNIDAFRMINDLGKQYTALNPTFVFLAEYMVALLALATLLYWFTRKERNRMMGICAVVSFVIAELLGKAAGHLHSNNQPFAELPDVNQLIDKAVGNSFPSDHTILFFSFCITFWLFRGKWGFLWGLLALIVGISRIWVGVHYPADVVAGALIASLSAYLVYQIVPRLSFVGNLLKVYEKVENAIISNKIKSTKQSR
jgi:undecaprenyl-diphosphatase